MNRLITYKVDHDPPYDDSQTHRQATFSLSEKVAEGRMKVFSSSDVERASSAAARHFLSVEMGISVRPDPPICV